MTHTRAYGRSKDSKVTGAATTPPVFDGTGSLGDRFHCFIWEKGVFKLIDFVLPSTALTCIAINNQGRVLAHYDYVTDFNDTIEQGWAIYDNGTWTNLNLPTFEHVGGLAISIADMNESETMLVQRWNSGPEWNGIFILDDAILYRVNPPESWVNVIPEE